MFSLPVTNAIFLLGLGLEHLLLLGCELQLPLLPLSLQLLLLLLQHHDLLLVAVHLVGLLHIPGVEVIFKCPEKEKYISCAMGVLIYGTTLPLFIPASH